MRITVQAVVHDDSDSIMSTAVLGVIDRDCGSDPSSGLGHFLHEAHSLLKALQAVVLARQIESGGPQWKWLQCQYASSCVSSRPSRGTHFWRATLPCSSVKATVRATGNRLEAEARQTIMDTADEVRRNSGATEPVRAALQIDAGYIRSIPREDGTRWFAAIASKLVLSGTTSTPAHAYVTVGYDPTKGMRQQAFLRSIGIGDDVPLTVLSDGGEDVERKRRGGEVETRAWLGWNPSGAKLAGAEFVTHSAALSGTFELAATCW